MARKKRVDADIPRQDPVPILQSPKSKPRKAPMCMVCEKKPATGHMVGRRGYLATPFCGTECGYVFACSVFMNEAFVWCDKHDCWSDKAGDCHFCIGDAMEASAKLGDDSPTQTIIVEGVQHGR